MKIIKKIFGKKSVLEVLACELYKSEIILIDLKKRATYYASLVDCCEKTAAELKQAIALASKANEKI